MTTTPDLYVTVTNKQYMADGVVLLELSGAGADLPTWDAGAHIDLFIGPFVRSYSLCGSTGGHGGYQVAVLNEPSGRGGSAYVHDRLQVGHQVGISLPRNHFELVDADRYVFVSGGIGITPIVPMIAAANDRGATWELHYGGRSRASMAFVDQLADHESRVTLYPEDQVGRIPLSELLTDVRPATKIFACGPPPLLDAVAAATAHWPAQSLHVERFVPKEFGTVANREFEVHLERRGTTHRIPAHRSILDVLDDAGVAVPTSCRVGTCGTCEVTVLAGVPDHRDSVLTTEEQADGKYVMLCVSRAVTATLTLDL
ncbi:putative oxidoreductase [Rhodococcoides trifolii]|uniref:Oxidoreductase n=1 Tax=Rhodococcoides trifolii TaxID=908250 RepID=A0A917LEP7_9NOCA|nr:PDR/VanB family oxidoreductase [Rhodococcus trifolii]GGG16563.1 putative oxidoreductase [Rhodococcus trifolii]